MICCEFESFELFELDGLDLLEGILKLLVSLVKVGFFIYVMGYEFGRYDVGIYYIF